MAESGARDARQDVSSSYTVMPLSHYAAQGTPLDVIQIGDEVTCGCSGRLGSSTPEARRTWDGFVQLLKAGAGGCAREGRLPPLPTIVHIDYEGDDGLTLLLRQHHQARC